MKTIWKYVIDRMFRTEHEIPAGAQFLSCEIQGEDICLWYLVNDSTEKEKKKFAIFGTGWDLDYEPEIKKYLGTVFEREYVWHVFEVKK